MNCACRTTALAIFVPNLARLSVFRLGGAPTPPRLSRRGASRPLLWHTGDARGLHYSSRRNGAEEAAASSSLEYTLERPRDDGQTAPSGGDGNTGARDSETKKQRVKKGTMSSESRIEERKQRGGPRKFETKPAKRELGGGKGRKPDSRVAAAVFRKRGGGGDNNNSNSTAAKGVAAEEDEDRPDKENWQVQKAALQEKFPEGWQPLKKLSPDALEGIRALNVQFPDVYTAAALAKRFEVSPEAIRRILKSKWKPSADEEVERQERWFNRGMKVWTRWAELGKKPPRRWREEGVKRPRLRPRPPPQPQFRVRTQSQGKRMRLMARHAQQLERPGRPDRGT